VEQKPPGRVILPAMPDTPASPRVLVAAGLVVDDRDRVLLARRPPDGPLALEWELPGGKIEPGEAPVAAVRRELEEELGLEVEVGRIWEVLYHQYPTLELVMLVYRSRPHPGSQPRCRQVADFAWLGIDALREHPILEADRKLVDRLLEEGIPPF
jgi:8-oxo-dGTP diphosphatase